MARKIDSRLIIEGTLITQTPIHVGGYGDSPDTDLPLARNGRDEFYIPGTSLAGVLRAWCEMAFGEKKAGELFGPRLKKGSSDDGHASFIIINDVPIPTDRHEIRDGVGINRIWGVAADKFKFDRVVLPKSTKLKFQMTVEIKDEAGKAASKAMVGHMLDALKNGKIRLGAARTRGLGRIKFDSDPNITYQSLKTRDGILKILHGKGDPNTIEDLKGSDTKLTVSPSKRIEICIDWEPKLPVMVKSGFDGMGVDMLPLVSGTLDGVALVLPGSSVKGALRSHAERIIRTLAADTIPRCNDFLKQIDLPLVRELFGARSKSKSEQKSSTVNQNETGDKKQKPIPGLGALSIADCYALESMNADHWLELEAADDGPQDKSYTQRDLWKAIKKLSGNNDDEKHLKFKKIDHVAIDRWTGGAAEGALFSVLVPDNTSWEKIHISIDLNRIPEETQNPAIILLLLVLRDLAENRLPLGFATNRGMGEINVKEIEIKNENKAITCLSEKLKLNQEFFKTIPEKLSDDWAKWLKGFQPAGEKK